MGLYVITISRITRVYADVVWQTLLIVNCSESLLSHNLWKNVKVRQALIAETALVKCGNITLQVLVVVSFLYSRKLVTSSLSILKKPWAYGWGLAPFPCVFDSKANQARLDRHKNESPHPLGCQWASDTYRFLSLSWKFYSYLNPLGNIG